MRETRLRQRYTVVVGHSMRPGIRAAPTSFADECCGTLAHLIAHVGALALLAIVSLHLWDELRGKTETYLIFQHPGAGPEHAFRGAQQAKARLPSAKLPGPAAMPKTFRTARRASIGRSCQGAGFHATFSFAAALCDAVWRN